MPAANFVWLLTNGNIFGACSSLRKGSRLGVLVTRFSCLEEQTPFSFVKGTRQEVRSCGFYLDDVGWGCCSEDETGMSGACCSSASNVSRIGWQEIARSACPRAVGSRKHPSTLPVRSARGVAPRVFLLEQTELTVTFLSEALRVLTSGGRERSQALRGTAEGASGGGEAGKVGGGLGVEGVLRELQAALAEEMALSVAKLRQEEEKAAAAAAGGGAANVSRCGLKLQASSCAPPSDTMRYFRGSPAPRSSLP